MIKDKDDDATIMREVLLMFVMGKLILNLGLTPACLDGQDLGF